MPRNRGEILSTRPHSANVLDANRFCKARTRVARHGFRQRSARSQTEPLTGQSAGAVESRSAMEMIVEAAE